MGNMIKEEKQAMATRIASEVVLLLKIKSVLESHPKGLKARQIADLIPKTDKTAINHILYSYKSEFEVKDYVWELKKQDTEMSQVVRGEMRCSPHGSRATKQKEVLKNLMFSIPFRIVQNVIEPVVIVVGKRGRGPRTYTT